MGDRNIIEWVIRGSDDQGRPVDVSAWDTAETAERVLEETRKLPDIYSFHGPYYVVQRTIREEDTGW